VQAIEDRGGDRSDADFRFLVAQRPSARAYFLQRLAKRTFLDSVYLVSCGRGRWRNIRRAGPVADMPAAPCPWTSHGGETRADGQIDGHDALRRHARHVDTVVPVENTDRTGIVKFGDDLFQERLRKRGDLDRRQIRKAKSNRRG